MHGAQWHGRRLRGVVKAMSWYEDGVNTGCGYSGTARAQEVNGRAGAGSAARALDNEAAGPALLLRARAVSFGGEDERRHGQVLVLPGCAPTTRRTSMADCSGNNRAHSRCCLRSRALAGLAITPRSTRGGAACTDSIPDIPSVIEPIHVDYIWNSVCHKVSSVSKIKRY
jgi:hypothetical protein